MRCVSLNQKGPQWDWSFMLWLKFRVVLSIFQDETHRQLCIAAVIVLKTGQVAQGLLIWWFDFGVILFVINNGGLPSLPSLSLFSSLTTTLFCTLQSMTVHWLEVITSVFAPLKRIHLSFHPQVQTSWTFTKGNFTNSRQDKHRFPIIPSHHVVHLVPRLAGRDILTKRTLQSTLLLLRH